MSSRSLRATDVDTGDNETGAPSPGETERILRGPGVRAGWSIRSFLATTTPLREQSWLGRFFGVSPLTRLSASLYRDALAEFVVAESVSDLGEGWVVIHGVAVRADDGASEKRDEVSHLLVGPSGVLAITAVNVSGAPVWVASSVFEQDGVRMPHLRDAEFNALRLSQYFFRISGVRAEVVPAVVVANPRALIINRAPRRVSVLTPSEVGEWVRSHAHALTEAEAAAIVDAATMLQPPASDDETMSESLARFRQVRRQLGRARRRRIAWLTFGLLTGWILLVLAAFVGNGLLQDVGFV